MCPELVEERDHFGVAQQRRRALGRFGEVGDDRRDGALVAAALEVAPAAQREGGGVAELTGPRVQVHVEARQRLAAGVVDDVEGPSVGMPGLG